MDFSKLISERRAVTFFDPQNNLTIDLLEEIVIWMKKK